jgi:type I restriction enzyme S subunit
MNWPPYLEYKDSGTEWIGSIPNEWSVGSFAKFGRFEGGAGFPHEYQGLTDEEIPFLKVNALGRASRIGVLESRDDTVSRRTARVLGAKILPKGTIVFAKVGAALLLGRIATVPTESCIDNNMMAFIPGEGVLPDFARYMLSQVRFDLLVNPGAVPSVNEGQMRRLLTAVPTRPEQQAISDFLDRETAKIDALIDKQEQLIATLREDRTATITHAVTKGIDPGVDMRGSGVQWLGDVPIHWSTRRLATTYRELDERLGNRAVPELLSVSIHLGVRPRRELVTDKEARADDFTKYKLCSAGDIVLNRMRAFQGGLGVAGQVGIVSPDYMVMRIHPTECADFLGYLMKTPWFVEQMTARLRGIGGVDQGNARTPRINPRDLGSIEVVLPPSGEQREIVDSLRSEVSTLDDLITKTEQLIETMREYRSALITDAVTGKIDVRAAA